ncbi:MAG: DUF4105 domain-containing protein [Candidatus Binatia bacterium]
MILRRVAFVLFAVVALLFTAWASAALAIDGPFAGGAAKLLAASWGIALAAILVMVRPGRRALLLVFLLDLGLTAWWLGIAPSNDRAWIPEVARLASVDLDGDVARFRNVRDFEYRSETDFTAKWEDRTYDLSKVRAVDLFISTWGAPLIAHTIMSWEFEDGRHLAVSIETRKQVGEEYSALLGFFRQFELYYVVADESDVIALRSNHRGETVALYRLSASPENARRILADYIESINDLVEMPVWYNALTQNCTTSIWQHAHNLNRDFSWDWRILVNGSLDALLYLRGSIDTSMPIEELRRRSDITAVAREAGDGENFSTKIRRGLPRMPASGGADPGRATGSDEAGRDVTTAKPE